LVCIGACTLAKGFPTLCNGANLAYKKEAFYKVGGFSDNEKYASGDDEFLFQKTFYRYPGKVKFLKNPDAFVTAFPAPDLKSFITQRKRWVSKSRRYANPKVTRVLYWVWLFNFFILFFLAMSLHKSSFILIVLFMLFIKLISEFIFFNSIKSFTGIRAKIFPTIAASLLHIPYTLFIGVYGNLGKYEWKGRRVN
jgi:cellulose synthase/poly-beta-1,6-N-acetylglucosamine synthase-like glycosyltransferase